MVLNSPIRTILNNPVLTALNDPIITVLSDPNIITQIYSCTYNPGAGRVRRLEPAKREALAEREPWCVDPFWGFGGFYRADRASGL